MDWKLFEVILKDRNRQKMLGNKRVFLRGCISKKTGMMFDRDPKDHGS